jgi:hypothetical protein
MIQAPLRTFLASGPVQVLATNLLDQNPWLCEQLGFSFVEWSVRQLSDAGRPRAALFLVGSAAVGFSLSPTKAGRAFRKLGAERPSDLDFALVDIELFDAAWAEMKRDDRQGRSSGIAPADREHVYWGRIAHRSIPSRTRPSRDISDMTNAARRSPEFRGYRASIRLYRERVDLESYTIWSLANLAKEGRA